MASAPVGAARGNKRGRGRPVKPGLREARRNAIVRAAYAVLTERGYENTSMSDVARQAGIAQGTLYRYVRSKRELLDHVFDYSIARAARALNVGSLADLDLTDYQQSVQLTRLFGSRLFALVDEDPAIVRLITVESSAIDTELRYRVTSLLSTLHAALAQLFQKANPDKHTADDRRIWDVLGRMVMGMAGPGLIMSIEEASSAERRAQYLATISAIAERGLMSELPEATRESG